MNARVRIAYVACFVLWGSTWMTIKVGLRDLPPFFFAGTRMLLAAAILLPFAWRAGLGRARQPGAGGALELVGDSSPLTKGPRAMTCQLAAL